MTTHKWSPEQRRKFQQTTAKKRATKLLGSNPPAHLEVTAVPVDHDYKMFLEGGGAKVTIEGTKFQVAVLAQRILK